MQTDTPPVAPPTSPPKPPLRSQVLPALVFAVFAIAIFAAIAATLYSVPISGATFDISWVDLAWLALFAPGLMVAPSDPFGLAAAITGIVLFVAAFLARLITRSTFRAILAMFVFAGLFGCSFAVWVFLRVKMVL